MGSTTNTAEKGVEQPVAGARATRLSGAPPDYLPARMLNEYVYCPRLFFYEWVEGLFTRSADTVEGSFRHEKLETRQDPLPPPASEGRIHSRSVTLSSEQHRLIATMDLVEGDGGEVSPVDYKKGRPKDGDAGPEAWPADRAQVCAQALILRDNGYAVNEAVLYYDATRQRVRVPIEAPLVGETVSAIESAREVARLGKIPRPLVDSPKCPRCSLVGICLPDETRYLDAAPTDGEHQLALFADEIDPLGGPLIAVSVERTAEPSVRRLVPARDDLRSLYVAGHGVTIGKSGEVLQIRRRDKPTEEVRLHEISQVNVYGNVQLTATAVQGLCRAERPIGHFSHGGWFFGTTTGLGLKNVFLRRAQFARANDVAFCLRVARDIVTSKIRNQRTLLLRNHVEPPALALRQLKHFADLAGSAEGLDELLGIEGTAARLYFSHFAGMLKGRDGEDSGETRFDFVHRNRRPPTDPVNSLLSFAYALLAKDLTVTCHLVGFDPFVGFFHQPRFGRPALALDLMEGFRPLIADSTVLTAINNRVIQPSDFIRAGRAVSLAPSGRKAFLHAYEQRMDALATHPIFGYRVSYRRILEIQARLLARVVSGEIASYPGFETR